MSEPAASALFDWNSVSHAEIGSSKRFRWVTSSLRRSYASKAVAYAVSSCDPQGRIAIRCKESTYA